MTLIERIEDLVQKVAPLWTNVHIVPRGAPRMLDPQLRGSVRFCQRLGSYLPNLQPQNRFQLTASAEQDSQLLKLDQVTDGLKPGNLLMVGNDLQEILDCDRQLLTVQTTTKLKTNHAAAEAVQLFGEQLRIVGPVTAGTKDIQVRGRYKVLPGDTVWIQADSTLLRSGTDYKVVAITTQYTASLDLWNSSIQLDIGIPRDMAIDDLLYLRGYPGYLSGVIDVPVDSRAATPLGPFVVDYVSGRLADGQDVKETLSLQRFQYDGTAIDAQPVIVGKNHPVTNVAIHQSSFLFFRRYLGTLTYRDDRLIMRNDASGRCQIWVELVPGLVGPVTWRSTVRFVSGDTNNVFVQFWPAVQQFVGGDNGGNSQLLSFQMPTGEANRITITTVGPPFAEIEMGQWTPTVETTAIQYGLQAEAVGPARWQAGSLQMKPMFRIRNELATKLDFTKLDSGSLLL